MEIDFLIMEGRNIVPIEVKSSKAVHHASLSKFIEQYKETHWNADNTLP